MISDPDQVLARLKEIGMGDEHPFVLASMMLKRFNGDWQEADAEFRRRARRFLNGGDEKTAAVMSLAARICVFFGCAR